MAGRKDAGEEVQEFVAVTVKDFKLTADALLQAINNALNSPKQNKEGKQSLSSLSKDGSKLQNIQVSDKNIKSFETSAKKYGIDYAVKRIPPESEKSPSTYIVFFKGKDMEQVNRAFKDYVKRQTKEREKPSVVKEMKAIQQEQQRNERTRERDHKKERGMQL